MTKWRSVGGVFYLGSTFFNGSGTLVHGISSGIFGSCTGISSSFLGGFNRFSGFVLRGSTGVFDSVSGFISFFFDRSTGVLQRVGSFLTCFFNVFSGSFGGFFSVIVIRVIVIISFFTANVNKRKAGGHGGSSKAA